MLREELAAALASTIEAKDARAVSTIRLILAALKDRDIAARDKGNGQGIDESELLQILRTMIAQRRESIETYEKSCRMELAQQESDEIDIIKRFLAEEMSDRDAAKAIKGLIKELGASNLKDMGRTMAALRERYPGRMDFAKANSVVKAQLG
ncbi:MAG: GatB/YqeY domain-containing protein [Alphaproteobacteria bacterium]|nr:GatB/YqeY domain-containing protein [Alphaproteobacteria bacterium]